MHFISSGPGPGNKTKEVLWIVLVGTNEATQIGLRKEVLTSTQPYENGYHL